MLTTLLNIVKLSSGRPQRFSYINTVRTALEECHTCLDIGCGNESFIRFLGLDYTVGVEGFPAALEQARQRATHHDFVYSDVKEISKYFSPGQFDCCVALDLIEHLQKEDGLKLLEDMERIAKNKILLFTPNGFLPQHSVDGNDLQEHLSGWTAEEMEGLGFKVIGMYGPKFLRGERHHHQYKPAVLFGIISAVIHFFYTRWMPQHAAAIICVKDLTSRTSERLKRT